MRHAFASDNYREAEVMAAPPGRLVVIVFDHLLGQLSRARVGMSMQNAEIYLPAIDRARAAVTELLVTLDRDQGGEIAQRLASLYLFALQELQELGVRPDALRVERNQRIFQELRDAFAQVALPARAEVA